MSQPLLLVCESEQEECETLRLGSLRQDGVLVRRV